MISNQTLTCPKGASLTFEIDMDTGSDLTGATAQWALCESWFDQARVYLTKTGTGDGLFIGQDAGVWKITVNLAPTDTLDIPSGLLYHDCKVLLQNGDVEGVANGPFSLDPSVNVLLTNAPSTRNLRGTQILGSIGQTAYGTAGALARNLQVAQSLVGIGQTSAISHGVTWVGPTWSPTDHHSELSVTGTNNEVLSRISLAGSVFGARSDTGLTTGQRYMEFDITAAHAVTGSPSDIWLGIANGAMPLDSFPFPLTNALAFGNDGGGIRVNGSVFDPSMTYGQGDVLGMLVDLDANTVKFRKNGGTYTAAYDTTYLRPSSDPIFIYALYATNYTTPHPVVTFGNV